MSRSTGVQEMDSPSLEDGYAGLRGGGPTTKNPVH